MPKLRFVSALLAVPSVLLVASVAGAVVAPGNLPALCGSGPACQPGFECAVVGESGCSAPACAPGATCPDPGPCVSTIEYGCVPAHCVSDAQCAAGMVCHAWTESCPSCACPANVPNCDCAAPACDPATVSVCTPRYDLPCQVASDCGPGFTCEDVQSCGCAGSGTAGSAPSAGAAPAPIPQGGSSSSDVPPPDCSCTSTGQKQCVAQQIMCTTLSTTMCPAGWTCEAEVATSPACPPDSPCVGKTAPSTSGWCRPPYYGAQSSGDLNHPEAGGSGGAVGSGGTTSIGTGSGMGTGTGQAAAGPVPIGTGTGTGTGSNMTGSGGSSTTPTSPGQPDASSDDSHDVAACSFGRASTSGGWLSLLALGSALLGLKRRRA